MILRMKKQQSWLTKRYLKYIEGTLVTGVPSILKKELFFCEENIKFYFNVNFSLYRRVY